MLHSKGLDTYMEKEEKKTQSQQLKETHAHRVIQGFKKDIKTTSLRAQANS